MSEPVPNPDPPAPRPWSVEWPPQEDYIRDVLMRCWADGSWGRYHGPHCDALTSALAEMYEVEHVILCSSGTAAVELALRSTGLPTPGLPASGLPAPGLPASGLPPTDDSANEVILCSYDFKANFQNVLTVGGAPVLVDCCERFPTINVDAAADAITSRTRCIITSHLHGCLANIEALRELSQRHQVLLIEDACQTPAATINGRRIGSFGDLGVLSFGGSKLLTAGRGGAVLCHDPVLAQRIRLYVQRGNEAYPLSELQAALILPQLQRLEAREQQRRASVERLRTSLQTTSQLACIAPAGHVLSSYYKVPFLLSLNGDRAQTESLAARMRLRQIALDPAFPAIHLTHSQRRFRISGTLKNAEHLHHRLMVLHHPALLSTEDAIVAMADEIQQELSAFCL